MRSEISYIINWGFHIIAMDLIIACENSSYSKICNQLICIVLLLIKSSQSQTTRG